MRGAKREVNQPSKYYKFRRRHQGGLTRRLNQEILHSESQ